MMNRYGISPLEFIDLKALMGDSSDNIPGVAGIGEKTGLKLIQQYKSIENLYLCIDEIKGSVKTKLEKDKEMAFMSKKLATINTMIPIDFDVEELKLKPINSDKLNEFFIEHNMLSLAKKLQSYAIGDQKDENETQDNTIANKIEISQDTEDFLKNMGEKIFIKIVKEHLPVNMQAILSVCILSNGKYYTINPDDLPKIKHILEDKKYKNTAMT